MNPADVAQSALPLSSSDLSVFALFLQVLQLTNGTFRIEPVQIAANEEYGFSIHRNIADRDGGHLDPGDDGSADGGRQDRRGLGAPVCPRGGGGVLRLAVA